MAKNFSELDSVAKQYGVGAGGRSGFLTLQTGNNRVRVVSGYEALAKHWANGKMLGICIGKDKGCEWCNAPDVIDEKTGKPKDKRPSPKFMMYVIDREADAALRAEAEIRGEDPNTVPPQIKIGEFGWSIVAAMRDLSLDEEYQFEGMPPYDMNIKKTVKGAGKNPSDTEYTVIAARTNTPLTDAEKDAILALTDIETVVERIKNKQLGRTEEETQAEDISQYGRESVEEIDPNEIDTYGSN